MLLIRLLVRLVLPVLILVLLILVLVVLILLVLVLVLLTAATAALLILQHFLGVDVVFLGVHVARILEQTLPESLHGSGVILTLKGNVALVVVVRGRMLRAGHLLVGFSKGLGSFVIVTLTVERRRQIVLSCH